MRKQSCYILNNEFTNILKRMWGLISDTSEKIVLPKNNQVPITGKWQVVKCLNKASGLQSPNQGSEWTGKIAQFSANAAVVGDYYWASPNYKIKRVNAEDYFINNLRSISGKFNITTKDVNVVTVTSSESFICEFIESDSKNAIAVVDENILILKKISDEVDLNFEKEIGSKYKKVEENNLNENNKISSDSGILLGFRTPKRQVIQTVLRNLVIEPYGFLLKAKAFNRLWKQMIYYFQGKPGSGRLG